MRLYLIRHGQTAWNAGQRVQGHTDIPLDDPGRKQAERLSKRFLDASLDLVLSSDLSRSLETARPIAQVTSARLEVTPALRERSFGEWEGLAFSEFSKLGSNSGDLAANAPYDVCPPGGESMSDAWDRLEPLVERLLLLDESVAVVSHGGPCALLLAKLLRGSIETARSFRPWPNCALTELVRRQDGYFQLMRYNDCSHLADLSEADRVAAR